MMGEVHEKCEPLTEEELRWFRAHRKWVEGEPKRKAEFARALAHGMDLSIKGAEQYIEELKQKEVQAKDS